MKNINFNLSIALTVAVGILALPGRALSQETLTPSTEETTPANAIVIDAEDLLQLGEQAYAVGDYQNALFHSNRLLQLDTDMAEAYLLRGRTLNELGRRQEAIADLERAAQEYAEENNASGRQLVLDSLDDL